MVTPEQLQAQQEVAKETKPKRVPLIPNSRARWSLAIAALGLAGITVLTGTAARSVEPLPTPIAQLSVESPRGSERFQVEFNPLDPRLGNSRRSRTPNPVYSTPDLKPSNSVARQLYESRRGSNFRPQVPEPISQEVIPTPTLGLPQTVELPKNVDPLIENIENFLIQKGIKDIVKIGNFKGEVEFLGDTPIFELPEAEGKYKKDQIEKGGYKIEPPLGMKIYKVYREVDLGNGQIQMDIWLVIQLGDREVTKFSKKDSKFQRATRGTWAIPMCFNCGDEKQEVKFAREIVEKPIDK